MGSPKLQSAGGVRWKEFAAANMSPAHAQGYSHTHGRGRSASSAPAAVSRGGVPLYSGDDDDDVEGRGVGPSAASTRASAGGTPLGADLEFDGAEDVELLPWEKRGLPARERVALWLAETPWSKRFEWAQVVLSLLTCALYALATYDLEGPISRGIQLACAAAFALYFALLLFVAENRPMYLFLTWGSWIDMVTITSLVASFVIWELGYGDTYAARLVRMFSSLRILRVQRLVVHYSEPGFTFQKWRLIFTLVALIFVATGVVQAVESAAQELPLHRAFYFVMITVTTVGYGDINPDTELGRLVVVGVLVVTAIVIPPRVAKLRNFYGRDAELIAFDPRSSGGSANKGDSHVLLCGPLDLWSIERFLAEFYHSNYGTQLTAVVIVAEFRPSKELRNLLARPKYSRVVTYLQGSVHSRSDLERAAIEQAGAAFILSPPPLQAGASGDTKRAASQNDAAVTMYAMSLRMVCPALPIFAQVSPPHLNNTLYNPRVVR